MSDQRDIKDLLRGSIRQEELKSRKRLNESKLLESDPPPQIDESTIATPQPNDTAQAAPIDDKLLEELKLRYQRIGYDADGHGVMRAGLQMLSTMSGAELRRVMQKVEEEKESLDKQEESKD